VPSAGAFADRLNVGAIEVVNAPERLLEVEFLTDDDVLTELRVAGRYVGIARVGERVLIIGS
jgi:hypothetical protein